MLEKPKLFLNVKEFWLLMAILVLVLLLRLSFFYGDYQDFKSKPFYFTNVEVLQQYEKESRGRPYTMLRVYSDRLGLTFFTRTQKKETFLNHQLRLKLFPEEKMRFVEYLGTSFINSEIKEVLGVKLGVKKSLLESVAKQHQSGMISNFYQAIFFATPLEKSLRDRVSMLGVSHLIALSGFHLAILWGVLFVLIRPCYRGLQQRFFPYRFDLIDVGFLVLVILGWYVWFVDAPASLLRSYMMMVIGWTLLVLGMELLSFTFLATIVMLLLVIFPKLLLSLAFWFSVLGVFYIFLLLHYFSTLHKVLITLMISFGIFVLMLPIVHLVFPVVTPLQLYSPFLSLLFGFFYPLSMGLHLVGLGYLLDVPLLELFTMRSDVHLVPLDKYYGMAYLLLSLGAIYSKRLFYLLFLVAFGFMGWMFIGFWV